jgi:hypothetical protein
MQMGWTKRPSSGGGGGSAPQLIEVQQVVSVSATSSTRVSIPTGFNSYDIRTVEASSDTGLEASVVIYEQATGSKKIYQSLAKAKVYDVCNIPCEDKDGTQMIHIEAFNHGTSNADIIVTLKLISIA